MSSRGGVRGRRGREEVGKSRRVCTRRGRQYEAFHRERRDLRLRSVAHEVSHDDGEARPEVPVRRGQGCRDGHDDMLAVPHERYLTASSRAVPLRRSIVDKRAASPRVREASRRARERFVASLLDARGVDDAHHSTGVERRGGDASGRLFRRWTAVHSSTATRRETAAEFIQARITMQGPAAFPCE
jgi:hypothetical protein